MAQSASSRSRALARSSGRSRSASASRTPGNSRYQIKIYCEGATEENYINDWRKEFREKTIVTFVDTPHTSSLEIVQSAVDDRKCDLVDSKRGKGSAYDEYWCIFDVDDDHKNGKLARALDLARGNGVHVALSHPCLEIWFLIHFEYFVKPEERKEIQKLAYEWLKCKKPNLPPAALTSLRENFEVARANAQRLDEKHALDGTRTPWNPSTNMWRLVDTIRLGGPVS